MGIRISSSPMRLCIVLFSRKGLCKDRCKWRSRGVMARLAGVGGRGCKR
jgi:hypothetical protein